jgi:hypothetical protein
MANRVASPLAVCVDDAIEAAILKVVEPSAIAAAIEADAQEAARRALRLGAEGGEIDALHLSLDLDLAPQPRRPRQHRGEGRGLSRPEPRKTSLGIAS